VSSVTRASAVIPGVAAGSRATSFAARTEKVVLLGGLRLHDTEGDVEGLGADVTQSRLDDGRVVVAQPVASERMRHSEHELAVVEADRTYLLEPGPELDLRDLVPYRLQDVVPDTVLAARHFSSPRFQRTTRSGDTRVLPSEPANGGQ